jgi:MFS family permease
MENIARLNIRLHSYINLLSGAVFLLPIITIFYEHTGLNLFEIIVISNVMTFCLWIFELPTSVFADTMGRKKSMIYSVIANFLSALMILIYPTIAGFAVAAIFRAFYFSFWSGTGQAFLDENLHILNERDKFGKVIGKFMAYEQFTLLLTPVIAAVILKFMGDAGYKILACLDVALATVLIVLVLQLKEIMKKPKFRTLKQIFYKNVKTGKIALSNVFRNNRLRLLLIYRSLSHHMLFFTIILLPTMSNKGMPDWISGGIITAAGVGALISTKFAYKIGEKYSYNFAWVISSVFQGALLIIAALVLDSWVLLAGVFVMFSVFYGLWGPAWNHVLVEETRGQAIATTRSIVMAVFALYITIGKQILSFIEVEYALMGLGVFILLVNLVLGKKILELKRN